MLDDIPIGPGRTAILQRFLTGLHPKEAAQIIDRKPDSISRIQKKTLKADLKDYLGKTVKGRDFLV